MDDGFTEYGDVQDFASLARAERSRPRLQNPDCEHVLKSCALKALDSWARSRVMTPRNDQVRMTGAWTLRSHRVGGECGCKGVSCRRVGVHVKGLPSRVDLDSRPGCVLRASCTCPAQNPSETHDAKKGIESLIRRFESVCDKIFSFPSFCYLYDYPLIYSCFTSLLHLYSAVRTGLGYRATISSDFLFTTLRFLTF